MCSNCGCGLPNDPMEVGHARKDANGKSITDETFVQTGKSQGMTKEQAMQETYNLLKKKFGK